MINVVNDTRAYMEAMSGLNNFYEGIFYLDVVAAFFGICFIGLIYYLVKKDID